MRVVAFAKLGLRCAACGGPIEKLEHGWVEWLLHLEGERTGQLSGFRIVHHSSGRRGGCYYGDGAADTHVQDHHLSFFVGVLGIQRLAARVSESKGVDESLGDLLFQLVRTADAGITAKPSMFEYGGRDEFRAAIDVWEAP